MLGRWLRRKVRQLGLGDRAGPRRRYRWTACSLTALPSLSSSPRIRSAPQEGLSRAIRAISSRISALRRGRPGRPRDFQRQNSRHAWRCQRDDRLGPDEHKVTAPIPPQHTDNQPEELVASAQTWASAGGAGQDGELLAQEEVLGQQVAAGAERGAEQSDDQE